jgi:Na+/glutamate symporter
MERNSKRDLRSLIDELYARVAHAVSSSATAVAAALAALIAQLLGIFPLYGALFTSVAHTATPTPSGAWKFAADTSAGPVNLTLTGSPAANQLLIVSVIGTASNPVNITPTLPAGVTIWNPATGAFATSATLTGGPGTTAWWQYDAPNNRFIEIV